MDVAEYSSSAECLSTIIKKKKSKKKKRFSDEQIRSLEVMFECETKLEAKKKVQLATELGLQPRQVAIWFQNKRARWKSKHIEKEYSKLLANYNNLASQFENLKKEKQALLSQLQKMKKEAKFDDEKESEEWDHPKMKFEGNYGCLVVSDDDSGIKAELMGLDEESELLRMVEPAAAGIGVAHSSSDDQNQIWGSLDSDDMINQTSGESVQWWDFWS
ncbi:hypothetical protein ACS0TY_002316 [Phlomoides rotata]